MPRCTSLVVACVLLAGCSSTDSRSTAPVDPGRSTTPTIVAPAEPINDDATTADTNPTAPPEVAPSSLSFADEEGGKYDE